jgi:tetratricopeptide (TPR) repeat protein
MSVDDRNRKKLDRAMAEKYFHSRGSASYEEGRFDSAIRFFRKALALEDLPYTRCHLGLAYLGKNDLDRALAEATKAIELAPSAAEYYYRRSAVWRRKGDDGMAGEDYRAACRLDANYGRIERIRTAARALQKAFGRTEGDKWPNGPEIKDEGLRNVLSEVNASIHARRAAVEDRSCVVACCPAYCCHFKGEPVLHGLYIGPWKLQAIRRFFKEKGLREEAFLGRLPFGREEERLRLVPLPVVVKDGAERVVFYPKRGDSMVGTAPARGMPKARDYRELAWITTEARACAFLDKGRCVIHDLGGEPALPACKEFLCLTGHIFLVLDWLGFAPRGQMLTKSMEELNGIALDGLLLASDRLYGNERLCRMENEMGSALEGAVEADARGDDGLVADLIGRYRDLEKRYRRAFSRQKRLLKEDVERLFQDPVRD